MRAIFLFFLISSSYAQQITICRNNLNKPIHDFQATYDTVAVALPPDSRILDVNVRIDTVVHSYDSDLRFYLRHLTTGKSFIRNVGQGGDNFIFTNINDSASCRIGSSGCNVPPFSGTYKPTTDSLTPFNFQAANGLWILTVTDTFQMDEGTLQAWCLQITYDNLLSAEETTGDLPGRFVLYQNYPNPFNAVSNFRFQISNLDHVTITVYDALGRKVETIVHNELEAGIYEIEWDASNYPSGVYFYTLQTPSFTETKKMLLLK